VGWAEPTIGVAQALVSDSHLSSALLRSTKSLGVSCIAT
jgi:hypothetical protein